MSALCCVAHVRVWHRTDMPPLFRDVRCWGQSGKHLLPASISPFSPKATSGYLRHNARPVGFRHQLDLYEPFEPSIDVSYVPRIYEVPS